MLQMSQMKFNKAQVRTEFSWLQSKEEFVLARLVLMVWTAIALTLLSSAHFTMIDNLNKPLTQAHKDGGADLS